MFSPTQELVFAFVGHITPLENGRLKSDEENVNNADYSLCPLSVDITLRIAQQIENYFSNT